MCLNMGLNTHSACAVVRQLFKQVFRDGFDVNTFGALREVFKHVFKHGFKHIRDVCHAGNCLNMCLNMGLNTFGMCGSQATL